MKGNRFVEMILRSPLHGMMSASTLLITVTGRKSGRKITTPVNYYREGDTLWVLTSRERQWWRNVQTCPEVLLTLRGKAMPGFAEVLLDEAQVAAQIGEYVRRFPLSARALGIHLVDGRAEPGNLAQAARTRLMVKISLANH